MKQLIQVYHQQRPLIVEIMSIYCVAINSKCIAYSIKVMIDFILCCLTDSRSEIDATIPAPMVYAWITTQLVEITMVSEIMWTMYFVIEQEFRTSELVTKRLRDFGVDEVHSGVGGTGVVGTIVGRLAPDKNHDTRYNSHFPRAFPNFPRMIPDFLRAIPNLQRILSMKSFRFDHSFSL